MKKLLGLLLVCTMILTGCGSKTNGDKLTTYKDYEMAHREITTFNYLGDYQATNMMVVSNFVDGLFEHNSSGEIINSLVDTYEKNADDSVWTFTLKEGIKWLKRDGTEYEEVKAQDFVAAIKYSLTAENLSNNESMITSFIKGAKEYYTASLDGVATEELWNQVGVKAIDDKTVEYTMVGSKPYFMTALTYGCYYPVNAEFLAEVGNQFGVDPDHILYNGCYLMDEFEKDSRKTYVKNDKYWDKENVPFEKVEIVIIESIARAYDLFENGEVDRAVLSIENMKTLSDQNDERLVETPTGPYSFVIWFNHDQTDNPNWNTAIKNENFRKTWFYGIDPTEYQKLINLLNPSSLNNYTYTSSGLVKTSDGIDYTKLEELAAFTGEGVEQLQPEKAMEYKAKAMEELKAQGVTFPVKVNYAYRSGDQSQSNTYQVIKASFEKSLGSDFIEVEGVPYIQNATSEIYEQGKQSFLLNGWGADFGDPYNYLFQLTKEGTMNQAFLHFEDPELDRMVEEADKILDLDERYHAFAKIEAYVLDKAYVSPFVTDGHEVQVTKINDYSKPTAKYGIASKKIKYWESKTEAYTKEEYAKFASESKR